VGIDGTTWGSSRARSLLVALVAGGIVLLAAGTPALGEALRGPGPTVVGPVGLRSIRAMQRWHSVAAAFDRAGATPDPLFVAADAASALAQEARANGWTSPAVPALVKVLVSTANPDGGFGLARSWDAFQDGSVNPATTSYTATTAGHVGPVLLAGFRAGVVSAPVVNRTLDWVLDLPRARGDRCIPYSASPNDLGEACVWNVHFGTAAWATQASAATGHRPADTAALAAGAVSMLTVARTDPTTGYLPYSSTQTRPQDIGHQLWTASSIDTLRGNRAAIDAMLAGPLWRVQAQRFRDYNVASAMSGIALFDCRYATDPLVLEFAASTARGNPYAFKALAAQARDVAGRCFTPSGALTSGQAQARSLRAPALLQPDLG